MERTFKSNWNLKFGDSLLEKTYQNDIDVSIRKYTNIFSLILLFGSFTAMIEISIIFHFVEKIPSFWFTFTMAVIILIISLILTILNLVTDNIKIKRKINYSNYFFFCFMFVNFRYPLVHFFDWDPIIFYSLLSAETIVRIIFLNHNLFDFFDFAILNILQTISLWLIYLPNGNPNTMKKNCLLLSALSFAIIVVIFFSYFLIKNQKIKYYYYSQEKKSQWFENILTKMSSGFLRLNLWEVIYMNTYLTEKIANWKSFDENKFCFKNQCSGNHKQYDPNILLLTVMKSLNTDMISINF